MLDIAKKVAETDETHFDCFFCDGQTSSSWWVKEGGGIVAGDYGVLNLYGCSLAKSPENRLALDLVALDGGHDDGFVVCCRAENRNAEILDMP